MQVHLSASGASNDVGATAFSVGDFDTTLLDINPMYALSAPDAYPIVWTEYTIDISFAFNGKIGFKYFVEGGEINFFFFFFFFFFLTAGGPSGNNGDYVGIDTLSLAEAPISPTE
jgi:hypothetical protein